MNNSSSSCGTELVYGYFESENHNLVDELEFVFLYFRANFLHKLYYKQ